MKASTLLMLFLLLVGCGGAPDAPVTTKITPSTLDFTSRARSTVITVKNNLETSALQFTLLPSTQRITLDPAKGSLAPGETEYITVTFDYKGLSKGQLLNESLALKTQPVDGVPSVKTIPLVFEMTVGGLDACGGLRSGSNSVGASQRAAPQGSPYADRELLVQLHTGLNTQASNTQAVGTQTAENAALRRVAVSVAQDYGLTLQGVPSANRPTLVTLPVGETVPEFAARLARDPRVAYAEPNYYLELLDVPNDPFLDAQWNLLDFGLPQAWAVETGTGKGVIAVIDSGVYGKHEDLSGKLYPGCDFYDGDNDAAPGLDSFDAGHGTHVAGIAAAVGNNGTGVAGVAYGPGVRIVPVKVFDDSGRTGTVDELLDGLLWSAGLPIEGVATNPHPADIVNMSLGIDPAKMQVNTLQSVNDVTQRVLASGVVMFAASGNGGLSDRIFAPGNSPSVLAVGSVDGDRRRSDFSNYAARGKSVDFMAPGGSSDNSECFSILSTLPQNDYDCMSGTSMASPFVAGVAALLLSRNSDLSPEQVKAKLTGSALFTSYMNAAEYGAGIVCAGSALGAATRCGR
ncbi:S8 family peptidase [soil metagenome]